MASDNEQSLHVHRNHAHVVVSSAYAVLLKLPRYSMVPVLAMLFPYIHIYNNKGAM